MCLEGARALGCRGKVRFPDPTTRHQNLGFEGEPLNPIPRAPKHETVNPDTLSDPTSNQTVSCFGLCLCMCIYIYTQTSVWMYAFMPAFLYVCMYVYKCMHICTSIYNCIHTYICICMHICIYICIYTCTYIYSYIYMYLTWTGRTLGRLPLHRRRRNLRRAPSALGKPSGWLCELRRVLWQCRRVS